VIEKAKGYNSGNDVKIRIIWSNISFEIWLLYHFKFFTKEMKEKALEKELDKIIGNDLNLKNKYKKSDKGFFEYLAEKEIKARINSKKSVQIHARKEYSVNESCSATNMYAFFEYIKQYKTI
jgi:hypothetical protein